MKIVRVLAASSLLFALLPLAFADTIVLKNGNTLTGTIEILEKKELVLSLYKEGSIKINRSEIKEIKSDEPIYVSASGGRKVSGQASTEGGKLVVQTASGPVTVPFADIETIRGQHEQDLFTGSLHPSLGQNWKGGASLGFGLARGNSDTSNLNIGMAAARKTHHDQLSMHFSSIYATSNGAVNANAILAGIRYDRNLAAQLFAFAAGDFTHDTLQGLNVRQIYSGGLGWHVINTETTSLDALAGINYTRETYGAGATATGITTGVNRNLPGLTVGETFIHKFSESTTLNQDFTFYPQLDDLSQYRFAFDVSAATKIHRWLGWQITVSDQYVTNPPILGTKSNDVILATGLNLAFDTTPK